MCQPLRPILRRTAAFVLLSMALLTACRAAPPPASPAPPAAAPTQTPLPPSATASPTPSPSPSPTLTPTASPTPQAGLRSAGDPYAPALGNTGYDVLHYDLALRIDPGETYLEGSATITAAARLHNLTEFSLDFAGFEIRSITLDGAAVDYLREGTKLVIRPAQPLAIDQEFVLALAYAGAPVQESSPYVPFFHHLGLQFLGNSAFAYNQPDGAHTWFPCNDHPTDKATFRFAVTVPAGLTAVANGTPAGVEELDGETTFRWEHPYPMATYLAMVAVGEYEIIDGSSPAGIPLQHFVFADIRQPFQDAADVTGEALDWMAQTFGPYPFDRYGFVTTRVIRASLETQGNVLLSDLMLNEETVVHEIAHMWFGNWVTMASWADMWHNEGFAVYISMMWETRDNPGALNIFMQNLEARVGREASADPLGNLSPNLLFGFDSYQRGALMLHTLRSLVGDEAFFQALRVYLERFGGGAATREDFFGVFEEVSGVELDGFVVEWLE